MNTTEHTWLDLVPPRGATPTELGPDSGPGDAISVTQHELKLFDLVMAAVGHFPAEADDYRQQVCRILGPQRVAVILQNSERGLSTPVTVEP
jgi:hypothetical protein